MKKKRDQVLNEPCVDTDAEAGTGETNSNWVMSKLLALLALLRLSTTEPGECARWSWSNDCLEGDRV